jgi:hypothetical protein
VRISPALYPNGKSETSSLSLGELASRANELCELREVRTFRLFVELASRANESARCLQLLFSSVSEKGSSSAFLNNSTSHLRAFTFSREPPAS